MKLRVASPIFILVSTLYFVVLPVRAQTGEPHKAVIARFKTPDHRIQDVAFSADGQQVAAGYGFYDDGGVTIWNIASKTTVATLLEKEAKRGGINKICFSSDGKLFAAADSNGNVWLWNVGNWKNSKQIFADKGDSNGLVFSPDGSKLAFSSDETALVYHIATGRSDVIFSGGKDSNEFDGISFAPDGSSVVVSGNQGTQIWDVATKRVVNNWKNREFNFFGLLSPKGNYFISGGGAVYGDKSVKIRKYSDGKVIKDLTDFRDGVFSLAISNTEKYFALSGGTYGGENAGFFSVWSLGEINEVGFSAFGDAPIKGLAFNKDDSVLAVGGSESEVVLFDISRLRGKQSTKRKEQMCGEIQTSDGKTYIRALSKIPGIMSQNFGFPWRLEIANPNSVQAANGLPVVLKNWSIESSSADDQARIDELKTISNDQAELANYIVFGVGENPGFGYAIKIFPNGNFVAAKRSGECISYGNLARFSTDYQTVRKRLLGQNFLSIPKEPLTIGASHFRTEFIEVVTDGFSELRTDADSFELLMKEKGKTLKREAFSSLAQKERNFIESLLKAGFSETVAK